MADRGPFRVARVLVFSLVCVLLAAIGHTLAGGHRPPLSLLVLGGAAVAVPAGRLAGRERTLGEMAGAVTVTQTALHLLYAFARPPRSPSVPLSARPPQHGEAMHGAYAPHGSGVAAKVADTELVGMTMPVTHLSPVMLLAHLVAGLGAAWWLRQGEALVWRLCRLPGAPLSALLHALALWQRWSRHRAQLAQRRVPPGIRAEDEVSCSARMLRHALARRGPPVLSPH